MKIFLLIILLADLTSFIVLFSFGLEFAILIKILTLAILVFISFFTLSNLKFQKFELFYFVLIGFLTLLAFSLKNLDNLILFQSSFLLVYPLFIIRIAKRNSDLIKIEKFENFILYFSIFNFLFMLFEMSNTKLLLNLGLSEFFQYVKGVSTGYNVNTNLPFNWHTNFGASTRRGAGLLMAPLASGMLSAFGCYVAFYKFFETSLKKYLIFFALIGFGLILSDSRGPMIFLILSIFIYYLKNRHKTTLQAVGIRNFLIFFLTISLIYISGPTIMSAILLQDERSPKHLMAFIGNLRDIFTIPFFGYGIGTEGAIVVRTNTQLNTNYYGEGSIFTIIYQCGLITGIIFLTWFYSLYKNCRELIKKNLITDKISPILLSSILILVSSAHIFTLSGFIYIWYFIGLHQNLNLVDFKNENTSSI